MSVTIGTQLGSHEITALLGKGEVYRARDTKLTREVVVLGRRQTTTSLRTGNGS